ncbi:hypothetical protein CsSME_00018403 [Camellia sinensis var. sinensis]
MVDDFGLTHLKSLRHPVEEGNVSPAIEINKLSHKVPVLGTGSAPTNVQLGKVNSVIDGLNPKKSKGQQEGKSTEYVDECRDPNILKSCHRQTKQRRDRCR